jgi:hypothetical protein
MYALTSGSLLPAVSQTLIVGTHIKTRRFKMEKKKIVINVCCGGFRLSEQGKKLYREKKRFSPTKKVYDSSIKRDDPDLVAVVEELGPLAGAEYSKLKVVAIPKFTRWVIEEYDGSEWISEKHRIWR